MKKIITNTDATIKIIGQIVKSSAFYAVGICSCQSGLTPAQNGDIQSPIISTYIIVLLVVLAFFLLPSYLLICCIRAYLYEKDVSFIVDEQNDSIQFQKGDVVKQFMLSDIEEWYRYHSRVSFDVYELYLKSGEVIRFSEMIPLYDKYLRRQNKLHRLPPLQVEDSMLRQYIKSSIDMPEGNMY